MRLLISGGVLSPGDEGMGIPRTLREITFNRPGTEAPNGPQPVESPPPIKRTGS
jgi:hypothetical protein